MYIGVSYTGSTHASGACRLGSIPSTPTRNINPLNGVFVLPLRDDRPGVSVLKYISCLEAIFNFGGTDTTLACNNTRCGMRLLKQMLS